MSAALAAAAPAPAPEPVRRKLSAARLVRLVMAAPRFADALMVGAVPYGAEIVLRAIATGIAKSDELGVFRPPAGPFPIAAVLGARLGLLGAEAQIDDDLEALIAAGMVLRCDDGGLTLPLDFDRLASPTRPAQALAAGALDHLPAKHKAAIENGRRGGRPAGSGRAPEGQRNLRLFSAVGSPVGSEPETHGETHRVSEREPGGFSDGDGLGSVVGFSVRGEVESQAAAAVSQTSLNPNGEKATAAASMAARASDNPETQTQTHGDETHGARTHEDGGFQQNPSQNPPSAPTQAAIDLAALGASLFNWRGGSARAAPPIIQRQLDAGYGVDEIAETMRQHAGREINGARFFDRVLASGRGEVGAQGSAKAPAGVAPQRPAANGAVELLARARERGRPLPELPP